MGKLESSHPMMEQTIQERTLHQIAQIIGSTVELDQILKEVAGLMSTLVKSDISVIQVTNPDGENLRYEHIGESIKGLVNEKHHQLITNILDHMAQTPQLIDDCWIKKFLLNQQLDPNEIKELIIVPLSFSDRTDGVLLVCNLFSDAQFREPARQQLEIVGRLVSQKIENEHLKAIVHQQNKETDTLRQAAAAVITELDLDQVLDRIFVNLKKVLDYDQAALYLLEGDYLHLITQHGYTTNDVHKNTSYPADHPLFKQALLTGKPIIISDKDMSDETWKEIQHNHSWIGIPLHMRGRAIGFLTIDRYQANYFIDSEATLAQSFANAATIALENARLFKELQALATTDSLTNIWNRRHFFQLAKVEFQRARRYRSPLSAILFDIDSFKVINDTYGHAAGDQVLSQMANICKDNLRHADILGRYGGEEFMAILPNTNIVQAIAIAERLRRIIASTPFITDRGQIHISASFGVAELDDTCPDIDTLLTHADQASYAAKYNGKNRVSTPENPYDQ